jgi:hypothetical protein
MANQVVQIQILSPTFSVNPVRMNAQTILSVIVKEVTVTVEPELLYSNEIKAGEV